MEAESVEESKQEQEADHTENDHYQDGVHLHVHLLPWKQCCSGQEAERHLRSIEYGRWGHCRYAWLDGGQVGHFQDDGKWLSARQFSDI